LVALVAMMRVWVRLGPLIPYTGMLDQADTVRVLLLTAEAKPQSENVV